VEWQTIEAAQPSEVASTFDGLRDRAAARLSVQNQGRTLQLHPHSPPLSAAIDGLRYLQQVVLPAPAAGRTLQLAARQAPAALSSPAATGGRKAEAVTDSIQGLLRVAVAEVHGLSCTSVMLNPISRLPDILPHQRQQRQQQQQQGSSSSGGNGSVRMQAPAYADAHGAACTGGAWSAPRLLPATRSGTASGPSTALNMTMQSANTALH
jgi:hypothetical protein